MDPQRLVAAIKIQTSDSVASSMIEQLKRPAGESPTAELLSLSNWFLGLAESDRVMLEKALQKSADQAIFGFFCILDGVRVFEDQPSDGRLELYYVNGDQRILLNDPKQEELHNLFNAG